MRMVLGTTRRRRGRPRQELAGFSQTREQLIRAGLAAMTEKGYAVTGIDEILTSVNVPKGSFYHYFGSKEGFGAELIDRYAEYFARKLDRFFLNEGRPPLQRLRDFVKDAEAGMARHHFKRGCLVGNLGQEMNALPKAFRVRLIDVLDDWQDSTARCLEAAKRAGQISKKADTKQLAAFFWIGWEGAVLRAKLERNAQPLAIFADGFFASIEG